MKLSSKTVPVLILLVCGAVASTTALAQRHKHGGGVRFGISIGAPIIAPSYYAPRYYSYPAYTYRAPAYVYRAPVYAYGYAAPAYVYPPQTYSYSYPAAQPPVTYIERSDTPAAAPPAQARSDSYYCNESDSYYPSVRECPGGWTRVPARPPSG
jgi:hypothetical protein